MRIIGTLVRAPVALTLGFAAVTVGAQTPGCTYTVVHCDSSPGRGLPASCKERRRRLWDSRLGSVRLVRGHAGEVVFGQSALPFGLTSPTVSGSRSNSSVPPM